MATTYSIAMADFSVPEDVEDPIVRLVDQDLSFRRAARRVLEAAGYRVRDYGSVGELLLAGVGSGPGCLILDIHMPGPNGLDLQDMIMRSAQPLPVIFVTAKASVHDTIRAMKGGAADFFLKPVDGETLVNAVKHAVADHLCRRRAMERMAALKARYATLTPRERQVADMVVAGALNKQIGAALGAAERTVKLHRANVMEKMGAHLLPDLVRAIVLLKGDVGELDELPLELAEEVEFPASPAARVAGAALHQRR